MKTNWIRSILSMVIVSVGMMVFAVTPGEWNDNFADSLAYAETYRVPIVVVWGNTSCSHCNKLFEELEKSSDFSDWLGKHRVVMVRKHEAYGNKDADNLAAKAWIKEINPSLGYFPFVGVYWKNDSGSIVCSKAFTGRDGNMPVTTPAGDLAKQFVGSLDQLVGGYVPEPLPTCEASFVTTDTEDDRLEAQKDTGIVYIPLSRLETGSEIVNTLELEYPTSQPKSFRFTWPVGVAKMTVPVEIDRSLFKPGKKIELSLIDANGETLDESEINMVEDRENLPINPHWIGEYTARSLPYGEWTMDFDTAKEKVRLYGGTLVAMFGGPLWCPNCVAIEDDVFSTKKFKDWARKNKIVLVHFDQGQASSPSTPEGTSRGRLLTLTQSTKGKSGASYLSRHGIDPDSAEVKAVIDRVTYLTDAWLAPETTAARLANPVVLLLNDEGTAVDARFQRQSEGYTMDLTENLYRLQDLVTLKGDDETKGYRSATKLELAADETTTVEYHINSRTFFFRLADVATGDYLKATITSSDRNVQDVAVSLVTADGRTLAAGTNRLIAESPLTAADIEAGLFLKTASYETPQSTFFGKATSFGAVLRLEAGKEKPAQTAEFSSLTKAEQKALNPSLYSKQAATVPVYEAIALGGRRLVGTLAVSVSAANKVSAKFTGEASVSFSGTWQEINLATGAVKTELTKKAYSLALAMTADGSFAATLREDSEAFGSGEAKACSGEVFAGNYTVTLVDADGFSGTASLTVKVSAKGVASVSGTMGDGTSVSVSANLSLNADGTAAVPVYKQSSKGTLSLCLAIDPLAAATWGDEGNMDTVRSVTGCQAVWTAADGAETAYAVYGGYWKNGATPQAICELFDLSKVLAVVVADAPVSAVKATTKGFTLASKDYLTSLSFTKSTGVFSGKAKISVGGKKVTANVKGVLLPGWIDCGCTGEPVLERPYGSGTLWYKVGGETVSLPVDLVAESAE